VSGLDIFLELEELFFDVHVDVGEALGGIAVVEFPAHVRGEGGNHVLVEAKVLLLTLNLTLRHSDISCKSRLQELFMALCNLELETAY